MHTLWVILFVIFVADAFLLVIAVLLQSGRGGGLAGALGGIGSPDSALGVRAASQIEKATGIMAVIFLATALALAFVSARQTRFTETPQTTGREAAAGDELTTGETSTAAASAQSGSGAGVTTPPARATTEAASTTPPARATTQAASTTPPAKTTEAAKPEPPESATSPPAATKE